MQCGLLSVDAALVQSEISAGRNRQNCVSGRSAIVQNEVDCVLANGVLKKCAKKSVLSCENDDDGLIRVV